MVIDIDAKVNRFVISEFVFNKATQLDEALLWYVVIEDGLFGIADNSFAVFPSVMQFPIVADSLNLCDDRSSRRQLDIICIGDSFSVNQDRNNTEMVVDVDAEYNVH